MNHIFVKNDKARHIAVHLVGSFFKLEQEAIGSMSTVYCDSLEAILSSVERITDIDCNDTFEIIGFVPTIAELDKLRALTNRAMISFIVSKNQITPEISREEEIAYTEDEGILTNVWKFYNSQIVPNFIEKLDLALSTERKPNDGLDEMRDLLDRLDALNHFDAMKLIDKVQEEVSEEGQDG